MQANKLNVALRYILQQAGAMEIMRLAKFIYLADYAYAKLFGDKQGFIDEHQRLQYGPVPATFYQEINTMLGIEIDRSGNIISLRKNEIDMTILDKKEIACLDKVMSDFKGKSLNQVKKAAYATEPMRAIQEEEERLGVPRGLVGQKMDFDTVKIHPLAVPVEDDLSFMDTEEFKSNLE